MLHCRALCLLRGLFRRQFHHLFRRLLPHLILRQQAVPGDLRVPPDLIKPGEVDCYLRLRRFYCRCPVRLDHRLHIGSDPLFALFHLEVVPGLKISSDLPVRLMYDRMYSISVKKQLVIPDLRPLAVLTDELTALCHLILGFLPFLLIHVDRICQRMPGKLAQFAKTGGKYIPPAVVIVLRHISPDFRKEMNSPFRFFKEHRGFLCFAAGQCIKCPEYLFI